MIRPGTQIGIATVLENKGKGIMLCKCECGKVFTKRLSTLRGSPQTGCGCGDIRKSGHGDYNSKEYRIWASMKYRCKTHKDYAGRGIVCCERWYDYENFLSDMGRCPGDNYWLERVDNDKGYSPDNCKWDTIYNQQNNRRNVRVITVDGKETTFQDLSKQTGLAMQCLRSRYDSGDRGERLVRPQDKRGRSRKVTKTLFPFMKYLFSPIYPLDNR